MPPRPETPYTPYATVTPSTQAPNDYIRTEASGADFGAQVGQATQGLGQQAEKVGNEGIDLATQQQGLINQALSQDAETKYQTQLADITAQYRSKEGLDAVAAHDQTVAQITQLRQQITQALPTGGAQRAFGKLAMWHEAHALSDVGGYYAQQTKMAALKSAGAVTQTSVASSGLYPVASDDSRFNDTMLSAVSGLNDQMAHSGYSGGTMDAKTGKMSWDTTTAAGQQAQSYYDAQYQKVTGEAWWNRIKTLSDDPAQGNVVNAYNVFQANRDQIPAQAQMEISAYLQPKLKGYNAHLIAGTALGKADSGYNSAVETAATTGGKPVTPAQITSAIGGQESSNNINSATSVQGAAGQYQITQPLFNQYAQPGESFQSKADLKTVSERALADYTKKYNNDPARVAVAWFSGPGNVAPAGSATPWINDAKDANGKSVSSYVSDVLSRVGTSTGLVTKADYYRAHEADIINQARQDALAAHPDDPEIADLAVARTQQQLSSVIRQQDLAYHSDSDLVYRAVNGNLTNGTSPQTVDQLRAVSPDVAAAWDRMQAQQPEQARSVAMHLLPENAKANGGKDGSTYGPAFYDVFNRIHAPDGSPNRITDPSQLYPLVGQPGGLTMSGLEKAREEIMGRRTPDGEAESAMRTQMFRNIHGMLTGTNDGLGIKDPKGEEIYLRFLAAAYPAIEREKAAGKTPYQIYDPNSPDYVGKVANGMKRTPAQYQADMTSTYQNAAATAQTPQVKASLADLEAEMRRRGLLKTAAVLPTAQVDNGPEVPH